MKRFLLILVIIQLTTAGAHAKEIGVIVLKAGWGPEAAGAAYPGDWNVPLLIEIQNPGPYDLKAMKLTLRFPNPFYLEYRRPGTIVRTHTQEKMLRGLKANATATLMYSLSISQNAKPGVYLAELEVSYLEDPLKRTEVPVFLTVSGRPKLVIEGVNLTPISPYPGDRLTVEMILRNKGSITLRDIEAELQLSSPFLPDALNHHRYISALARGESSVINFTLRVSGNAEAGGYVIPLQLRYNADGRSVEKNISIGITVATPASFELSGISVSPVSGYNGGIPVIPCCTDVELEFDVVNTARSEVASVEVAAEQGQGYQIHPTNIYIGTLNPDDFSTVRFTVKAGGNPGKIVIPIRILYTDENNNRSSIYKQVSLEITNYSENKSRKSGFISRLLRWLLGI